MGESIRENAEAFSSGEEEIVNLKAPLSKMHSNHKMQNGYVGGGVPPVMYASVNQLVDGTMTNHTSPKGRNGPKQFRLSHQKQRIMSA